MAGSRLSSARFRNGVSYTQSDATQSAWRPEVSGPAGQVKAGRVAKFNWTTRLALYLPSASDLRVTLSLGPSRSSGDNTALEMTAPNNPPSHLISEPLLATVLFGMTGRYSCKLQCSRFNSFRKLRRQVDSFKVEFALLRVAPAPCGSLATTMALMTPRRSSPNPRLPLRGKATARK